MAYDAVPVREDGFTVDDLDAMPEDGRRYELVDGVLLVSPAPLPRHQIAVIELLRVLMATCPPEFYVLTAPLDVRRGIRTSVQPDVLVVRRDAIDVDARAIDPPLLAVEVLSPSSRLVDRGLKRLTYARLGVPSYWVVDPEVPSVEVMALDATGEDYLLVGAASGATPLEVTTPFPATVRPLDLRGGF